jgi:hypothetical protein
MWATARQVLFHLVKSDDPDPRLDGLRPHIFEAALGRDAAEDLLAVLEESQGAPGAQVKAGAGTEGTAQARELGEAHAIESLRHPAQDLVGATGEAD